MSDVGADERRDADDEQVASRTTDDATLNQAFDLLCDPYRRSVIAELQRTANGVASVEELVDHLLAQDITEGDRVSVRVSLHHTTLPKLADTSVLDYDQRTSTVRYYGSDIVERLMATVAP